MACKHDESAVCARLTRWSGRSRRAISCTGWHSGRRVRCWRRLVYYISGRKVQHTNGRSDGTQHHLLRFRKRAACADVLRARSFYTRFTPYVGGLTLLTLKKRKCCICGRWVRLKKSQLPNYRHLEPNMRAITHTLPRKKLMFDLLF